MLMTYLRVVVARPPGLQFQTPSTIHPPPVCSLRTIALLVEILTPVALRFLPDSNATEDRSCSLLDWVHRIEAVPPAAATRPPGYNTGSARTRRRKDCYCLATLVEGWSAGGRARDVLKVGGCAGGRIYVEVVARRVNRRPKTARRAAKLFQAHRHSFAPSTMVSSGLAICTPGLLTVLLSSHSLRYVFPGKSGRLSQE